MNCATSVDMSHIDWLFINLFWLVQGHTNWWRIHSCHVRKVLLCAYATMSWFLITKTTQNEFSLEIFSQILCKIHVFVGKFSSSRSPRQGIFTTSASLLSNFPFMSFEAVAFVFQLNSYSWDLKQGHYLHEHYGLCSHAYSELRWRSKNMVAYTKRNGPLETSSELSDLWCCWSGGTLSFVVGSTWACKEAESNCPNCTRCIVACKIIAIYVKHSNVHVLQLPSDFIRSVM